MAIEFTQYLRPDGRTTAISIERPDHIEAMADAFVATGGRFEIEMLRDGTVSMTAERDDDLIAIRLCPNGPAVPITVDELVRAAVAALGAP